MEEKTDIKDSPFNVTEQYVKEVQQSAEIISLHRGYEKALMEQGVEYSSEILELRKELKETALSKRNWKMVSIILVFGFGIIAFGSTLMAILK